MALRRVRVRLVDVPVPLFRAAEQHANDLLREVALMAASRPDLEEGALFSTMLADADRVAHRPAVRQRVAEAIDLAQRAGHLTVTIEFDADTRAADSVQAWEELLRRFDVMSREERLLTLPADAELAAYRAWFVTELVEQVRTGREPISWTSVRDATLAGAR